MKHRALFTLAFILGCRPNPGNTGQPDLPEVGTPPRVPTPIHAETSPPDTSDAPPTPPALRVQGLDDAIGLPVARILRTLGMPDAPTFSFVLFEVSGFDYCRARSPKENVKSCFYDGSELPSEALAPFGIAVVETLPDGLMNVHSFRFMEEGFWVPALSSDESSGRGFDVWPTLTELTYAPIRILDAQVVDADTDGEIELLLYVQYETLVFAIDPNVHEGTPDPTRSIEDSFTLDEERKRLMMLRDDLTFELNVATYGRSQYLEDGTEPYDFLQDEYRWEDGKLVLEWCTSYPGLAEFSCSAAVLCPAPTSRVVFTHDAKGDYFIGKEEELMPKVTGCPSP